MLNKYWFKPKRWGYGAYPSTWEGWLVTVALIGFTIYRSNLAEQNVTRFLLEIVFIVIVFIVIAKQKTQEEWKWRWGGN